MTDSFGWRAAIPGVVRAQLHNGQDYAAPIGAPVYAAHAGRVSRLWWDEFANGDPAGGNMLKISSANLSTSYAHLSGYAVAVGQHVQAGDLVGYVGKTGAATGPHLHFILAINGQEVNPVPYIDSSLPVGGNVALSDQDLDKITARVSWALAFNARERGGSSDGSTGMTLFELLRALPEQAAAAVLDARVPRRGDGLPEALRDKDTTLRSVISWYDANLAATVDAVKLAAIGAGADPMLLNEAIAKALAAAGMTPAAVAKAVNDDLAERVKG